MTHTQIRTRSDRKRRRRSERRSRLATTGVLAALVVLLLTAPASGGAAVEATSDGTAVPAITYCDQELELVALVNDYRESRGLRPLLVTDYLSDAARKHVSDMIRYGFSGHTTVHSDWFPAGALYTERMALCGYAYDTAAGEDCGYGYAGAPEVFSAWRQSATHDANMLGVDFKVMGVGFQQGGSWGAYWCADFGGYIDYRLVAAAGDGQVQLTWNDFENATGYNLYRDGLRLNTAPLSQAAYLDSGLAGGTAHAYQVTALLDELEYEKSGAVPATPREPSQPGNPVFLDVPATHAYQEAIEQMAAADVIGGYAVTGGREFRPENPVLRAQFAKMIAGVLGLAVTEDLTSSFTDLGVDDPADLYPHEYVAAAYSAGIVRGRSAAFFAPWDSVKRTQVVTMVVRALRTLHPGVLAAPPAEYENAWGATYDAEQGPLARLAEHNGLLAGLPLDGDAADPWGVMSRGEVAQVLWNVMQRLTEP